MRGIWSRQRKDAPLISRLLKNYDFKVVITRVLMRKEL